MAIVKIPQSEFQNITPVEDTGVVRGGVDLGINLLRGTLNAAKGISDSVKVNNPVSKAIQTGTEFVGKGLSPGAVAQEQINAQRSAGAAGKGAGTEIGAALQNFADAPLDTIAQGAGTIVPTLLAQRLPGVRNSPVAQKAVGAGTGAAMAAGFVKSGIYDGVEKDYLASGASPEEAAARAEDAQRYTGENWDQIALGAGLGALASVSGVEKALLPGVLGAGAKAQVGQGVRNMLKETLKGGFAEAIPEAIQGGQERLAENVALQREGFDVDTFKGVAGNATLEGLAGGVLGGGVGAAQAAISPREKLKQTLLESGSPGPLTQAAVAGINSGASDNIAAAGATQTPSRLEPMRDFVESNQDGLERLISGAGGVAGVRRVLGDQAASEFSAFYNIARNPEASPAARKLALTAVGAISQRMIDSAPSQDQATSSFAVPPQPQQESSNVSVPTQPTPTNVDQRAAGVGIDNGNGSPALVPSGADNPAGRRSDDQRGRPGIGQSGASSRAAPAVPEQAVDARAGSGDALTAAPVAPAVGDIVESGGVRFRKTENGYERVQAPVDVGGTDIPLINGNDQKANEAATSDLNERPAPTDGQKQAGNYKKGQIKLAGLSVSVENPAGSKRQGKGADGKPWSNTMAGHYGYIKGVAARAPDKEHVDVYVKPGSPDDFAGDVYVVNQVDPVTGKFDEPKVMMGYDSQEEAEQAYQASYSDDWKGNGGVVPVAMPKFKEMLQDKQAFLKPVVAEAVTQIPEKVLAPRVDSIPSMAFGPGAIQPKVIAEGRQLFRETNQSGLDDLLRGDSTFDYNGVFVADNKDIAIGQSDNKGVMVEFRPNSLSGRENIKPGTGNIAGREYKVDIVAPRAVQSVTFANPKFEKGLGGISIRRLKAEFDREVNPDGSITYTRKPQFGSSDLAALQDSSPSQEAKPLKGADKYNSLVAQWNDLADRYKAADDQGKAIIKPAMDLLDSEMKKVGRESMIDAKRQIAEAGKKRAAEEAEQFKAMAQGERLRPSEFSEGKGIFWEKTGPDEWTGRGEWFNSGKTMTSSEMAARGGFLPMPATVFQAESKVEGVAKTADPAEEDDGFIKMTKQELQDEQIRQQQERIAEEKRKRPTDERGKRVKAQKIEELEKRLEEYRIFIAKQNRPQPEGGKQGSLIQSKTSEADEPSLGADSVSKLNDEAGAEEGKQQVATKGETPAADYQNRQHTVAVHKNLFERILDYKVTADEVKASFNSLIDNKESLLEELGKMTKPELLDRFPGIGFRYKNERKDRVIEAAYNDMLDDFALRNSISWGMSSGLDGYAAGVRAFIEKITDEDVRAYADKVNAARSEREAERQGRNAGMQEPKTLDDFQNLLRSKMGTGLDFKQARLSLSPEQRATFDDLTASKTMAERAGRKENQKTEVRVAGQTVSGQIIETKHTKKGHDLYVVQLSERIERDDYNTLNAGAKSLGGYYSAFRGNGAVPGFQFTTRENAEAFVALAGGNKEAAQDAVKERRDAFEDDRSQSAVERLTEMAAKLEERADSELNRDRKVNTTRRAGMAERAERAASAEKATAKTMRNIANAIQTGSAKYLGQVRQKSQVEYLQRALTSAQLEMLRQQYPSYADQEKHKFDPMTPEVADYAEFPGYRLRRSDWAALGRAMVEIDGLKTDGKRILSVADDVTAAYLKFAKENITKVGVFANQKGERAVFTSKADAENSISRSGFKGKAVVLPFKRGENLIVLSPAEAQLRGIWRGDDDQYIEVRSDFGAELVQKIGKANRRAAKVELPWQLENAHDRREKLRRMGIETPAEFRAALREMISLRETPAESDKVKKLERAMVGRRNDGLDFFPTPSSTADEMVEAADIKDGMTVLEPSAGMGHIAERIRETGVEPDVVEISGDRRELLEAKGFNVVASDFMELTEQYDRIIMNPPFSDRRDEAHVRHAYELLKPNGRLVAIMGEGVFFGSDRRAGEFRDWLEAVGGTSEKLESGTFMDPSLPVTTSVAARMVVIDKGTGPAFSRSAMKSVDANIQRGERAMNQVLLDRADVARAMYHNELGWIDFVWGDNLKGVQHIIKQRTIKDGLTVDQVYQLLTERIVDAVATGNLVRVREFQVSRQVVLEKNGYEAVLVRNKGSNGWVLSGWKVKTPGAKTGGNDPAKATDTAADSTDGRAVSGVMAELSSLAEQAVNNPALSRGAPGGMPVDVVQTITDAIGQRWKGAPEIIVVSDMNDARIRKVVRDENQRQLSQGATGEPEGFFDAGKVYVVASQMRSVNDVVRVLFHETLGHAGLRGVFGEELKPILRQIANMRKAEVAAKAAEYGLNMEVESDRLIAAEEVLAVMAQTKPEIGFVKRAIAAIRAWLRQHVPGFAKMQMTDNDIIANFILPARQFIESGRAELSLREGQNPPLPAMSRDDARAILNGEPVASLNSEDAPKGGFAAVVDWAAEIFASQGGKAVRDGFGEVALDRRAAKDSMAHGGANRYKKVAFAAVKDVIEKGALVWSGKDGREDSYYFSGPVEIDGVTNIETVLVKKDFNTKRMYLHSIITKQNLLNQGVSRVDAVASERSGSIDSEGIARILQNLMTDNQGDGNTAFSRASTATPEGVMGSGARRAAFDMGVMNKALDVLKQPSMRTFGVISGIRTQLDKARQDPTGFGRVFDLMVGFENDLRRTAARPSTLAPSIFPVDNEGMVNGLKKLLKGKQNSAADKAVADALFDGTLDGDDAFSGKVFTDAELMDRGFTPAQVTKYREARAVVDASLMEAAAATAFQMAQKYIPGYKDAIRDNPSMASDLVPTALENAAQRVQDKISSTADPKELGRLENQLLSITETIDAVRLVFERVGQLQQAGYMPLMRFGKYTVTGYDATGAVEYHARFDTETEAKLAESWAKVRFERAERGIAPTNPNTLFAGVDPETVSLFVNQLGVKFGDESVNESVMQEWYRRAVSERSAWKRLINRKGTPGYDDDIERVLASFITSNARFAAQAYNRGGILDAMNFLQTDPEYKRRGDVFDEANKLKEYMDNPEEPFAVGRSLMFTWFLGGSISSAVVNLTQPVLMTFPYLSQWGPAKAGQYLAGAAKDAVRPTGIQDQGMKDVLARASEMGIVEPQEIHHLYRLGMKSLLSRVPAGENFRTRLQGAGQMWGYLFGQAEKFNRRLTFIAAYRMAVDNPDLGDAYEFAERAVEETQGIYSKANRPNWARGTGSLGAVGAAAFTFKQYSIAYVELLRRMWMAGPEGKRAAGIMLGMLVLASGLQGLPFADDGEDALDTALQFMGREGNTKADVRNWALDMLGEEAGLFALYGVSAFLPLDIQSRLGMANLIPSTTLLKPSEDNKARALGELFGAPGSYLTDIADAISAWEAGKSGVDTLIEMAPVAIKNLNKGFDMAADGFYSDTRGKKVVDTDAGDSFIKGVLGFQPTKVSMETRRLGSIQQSVSRVKQKEGDIADLLAQGRFEGSQEKIQRAMQMLNDWNERNPNLRISIAPRQIIQRLRAMAMTREQRLLKTIPKELRASLIE
ncbi:PLxRFG domain-containing protein [Pseudomethylobacillus aquaticus]|uniref:PLxRFG domain-containing protein n=1 Tax=Pseudomethylobacillus aquaticus TaxID=2676064 RepID=A0A3N0V610_9PROT|nr:PLxRFG domain-containing protein [Pseudomethylobacillus aquaticus]ROH88014.1 PLxRFG domain-containing protein [Pseudomethylobacillus aquaticus]